MSTLGNSIRIITARLSRLSEKRIILKKGTSYFDIREVKQNPLHTVPAADNNALTNWVLSFLFKKFFHDCLYKVVRRRFGFA